jgi:hypothetical protein
MQPQQQPGRGSIYGAGGEEIRTLACEAGFHARSWLMERAQDGL